jgi:hypothetical protein
MDRHHINPPYFPIRKQIQRACEKIRRSWSELQRREREVTGNGKLQVPCPVRSFAVDVPGLEDES